MPGLFITSTGTGIGKTFVTAGLIRYLRSEGRKVDAFKPVISGFNPAQVADSDTAMLLSALDLPQNDAQVGTQDRSRWLAATSHACVRGRQPVGSRPEGLVAGGR